MATVIILLPYTLKGRAKIPKYIVSKCLCLYLKIRETRASCYKVSLEENIYFKCASLIVLNMKRKKNEK